MTDLESQAPAPARFLTSAKTGVLLCLEWNALLALYVAYAFLVPNLHWAVGLGDKVSVVRRLDNGEPADSRDGTSVPALHVAARTGQPEMVRLLLGRGADVNLKDGYNSERWTALDYALREKHAEVCGILIAHGARISDPDETIEQYALRRGCPECLEEMRRNGLQPGT